MRTVLMAASAVAMLAAGSAEAQRVVRAGPGMAPTGGAGFGRAMAPGAGYAVPGAPRVGTPMAGRPMPGGAAAGWSRPAIAAPGGTHPGVYGGGVYPGTPAHGGGYHGGEYAGGGRWGSNVGGHWWAGVNAPGGWRAYRRPSRGWTLPGYWIAPSFAIADWSTYGLGAPPAGYGWSRYYDDAVLIDGGGRVYDSVDGIDWTRDDVGYADGEGEVYAGPAERGYAPPPGYDQSSPYAATAGYAPGYPPAYVEKRNSGVGGALVGAGVGGVAGNLVAGRGNRLAGTLIGAGVGGAAGYAVDRSRRHSVPVAPGAPNGYPGRYKPAYAPGAGYAPPPPPAVGPAGVWRSGNGTTVSTTSSGSYYGGSTTVVTVQTAPVVTTTTTEIIEDSVTYSRHRAPVRHKWVRRPACLCR